MIHFSRKTEYAILAIEHMARKESIAANAVAVTNTREISDAYHIPYPLLAKVLQRLATKGLIKATHGTKGGYVLAKRAAEISVADVVEIFEGTLAVAECLREEETVTCPQWNGCHIKDPFLELNNKIHDLLVNTKITDLTAKQEKLYGIEPSPGR